MIRIGIGFERLLFMMLIYLLIQHIVACLWIFVARVNEDSTKNWIFMNQQ